MVSGQVIVCLCDKKGQKLVFQSSSEPTFKNDPTKSVSFIDKMVLGINVKELWTFYGQLQVRTKKTKKQKKTKQISKKNWKEFILKHKML